MPTSPLVTHGAAGDPIFCRERELARLDELVDGLLERGAALLVLRTTGVQSEAQLSFAGLHQLVLPELRHADRLPAPQQTRSSSDLRPREVGQAERDKPKHP